MVHSRRNVGDLPKKEINAEAASGIGGWRAGGEEPGMRLRDIRRWFQETSGRIAWSPCGRFIASASQDKTICI